MKRRYRWHPDVPDHRDQMFMVGPTPIPQDVDLRDRCPPIFDQQSLGSCTAQALAFALQYNEQQDHQACTEIPSRLFIYYCERAKDGTINEDAGSSLRTGIKCVNKTGAPPESLWPYDEDHFSDKPPIEAWAAARYYRAIRYARVGQAKSLMLQCLGQGLPFICGIPVYESFESDDVRASGMVPMPGDDEAMVGGHAVSIVGFRSADKTWIGRNSWGRAWGDRGYFYLPEAYLLTLGRDFWVVRKVT